MPLTGLSDRMLLRAATGSIALANGPRARQFGFELVAMLLVGAFLAFLAWGMGQLTAPITLLQKEAITLSPDSLPYYALRTTLRMLIAVVISFVFTLIYATLAAKSRKAGQILIPLLDILQSVPVLGYISFTVTGFIALFPHSMLGVECAAIFAIFTAQAWNMTFSLYQSLRTLPEEMSEAAFVFRLSGWQKFWKVELPFALPGLIWNMMMSMSGGWFFVVASEAITVGNQNILLPGIGSYIALAIGEQNMQAIAYAIGTMAIVILLYDQFLFRPLVAWSDKFRYDQSMREEVPTSWVLDLFGKSRMWKKITSPLKQFLQKLSSVSLFTSSGVQEKFSEREAKLLDYLWYSLVAIAGIMAFRHLLTFFETSITFQDIKLVVTLASYTLLRVMVLIVLASFVWVPIGVLIGLNPRLTRLLQPVAQLMAAFPANLFFPLAVILISKFILDPDIWLSPLMILGTQWYILFNVIAGASVFPNDLRDVARNFKVHGWQWWRDVMLPGIFPYFLTGAITAAGGAWNASIVAEAVSWGNKHYQAQGLGSYIAQMTEKGDYAHIALGVGVMALTVVSFNALVWRKLYNVTTKTLRFD